MGYELVLLVSFVLHKELLSWRRKGERAGQSQLLWTDVVRTSDKQEKNITSEEEDIGFCCSEDHMGEDKTQHSYEQKNTKVGQEKK